MPKGTPKPNNNEAACDTIVCNFIKARIAVCEEGIACWYAVVRGGSEDDDASDNAIKRIEYKCRYLLITLKFALEKMGEVNRPTWEQCCQHAIEVMTNACDDYITFADTIKDWHIQLRDSGDDKFPHPNPQVAAGQIAEPRFFTSCPGAKLQFLSQADEFARKSELTAETLTDYVNSVIVPNQLRLHNRETKDVQNHLSQSDFISSFGLGKGRGRPPKHGDEDAQQQERNGISQATVLRWMNLYGYKWCTARKHYYNDTHEHPQTIKARSLFIQTVLFQYEVRGLLWISIPKVDADKLRQQG
eukprot:scaffold12932_cov97-Skeletonema_menzelii.AAC.2